MSNEVKDMIVAAANKDGAAFKAKFDAVISQKVGETLQTQRQEIAKNTFGNIRVPTGESVGEMSLEEASKHAVITVGKKSSSMKMGDQTASEPGPPVVAVKKLKALSKKWGAKTVEEIKEDASAEGN